MNYWQAMRSLGRDARLMVVIMVLFQVSFLGASGTLTNLYLIRLGCDLTFIGALAAVVFGVYFWGLRAAAAPAGNR
jgi:hypothetical protein